MSMTPRSRRWPRAARYLRDVPAGAVAEAVAAGRFGPTVDPAALAACDAVFICVPTPFTQQKEPDVRHIAAAAAQVARCGRAGQLVVVRRTSYPGTTEEVVRPALEGAGRVVGRDVFLAFAPERTDPGNTRYPVEQVPVVVGGCDPVSTRLAAHLLERLGCPVIAVSSPAAAEMAKLLENIFRNVNIALVNQVAQLCERMGLDIWEIVDAAATNPYGFMAFRPGLVGGHCIPVDPYYLVWKAREYDFHMDFIELAARVNEEMPFELYSSDCLITDPDWQPIRWSINDPRRATFWGQIPPKSWFDEASLVEPITDGTLLEPTAPLLHDRPSFVT